jgi:HlyD family secretion protein
MTRNIRPQFYDDAEPRWMGDSRQEAVGPQGAALILELQRLRGAFDDQGADDGGSRRPRRAPPRQRSQKRRKGTIGRAIDVCLVQLGLNAPEPVEPRRGPSGNRSASAAPRRRSPALVPDGLRPSDVTPRPLDVSRFLPEQPDRADRRSPRFEPRPASFEPPQLPQPPRAGAVVPGSGAPNARMPATIAERPFEANPPRVGSNLPRVYDANQNVARPNDTFRDKLTAGVTFLVSRDKVAQASAPGDPLSIGVGRAYENELRTGLRVLIAGVVLIGGWAGFVPLSAAVTVPGNLVVQSNVKAIQHPTGGVIAEIAVSNGMRVEPGQLLVRLDATQARSSLQVVNKQLDDYRAKIARLIAERDGVSDLEFPKDMMARSDEPGMKAILASELSLFNARTKTLTSQKDLLQNRVSQLGEEITGLDSQLKSKASQIDLIAGELKGVQDLYDKRLVPLTRLTTLQRESARIDGERGQMVSSIAETKAKIGETQLQVVKIDQDFRTEVAKELNEAQAKEAELAEHAVAAKDQLDRIELHSPTAGVVNQLNVHTIGGVIRAGDTIMEIVPDSDDLLIEAHVQPKDINDVKMGQTALVAFSALNARTTPKLNGVVSYVSADASKDKDQLGAPGPVFTVRVMIPEDERRRLGDEQLVAGMPVELFMKSGSHTMLNYLFKPITEQLGHAFIER